jgi:hypothetical protein
LLAQRPTVRCCAILPSRADAELGYEYLPEEELPADAPSALVVGIEDARLQEAVDLTHLQCTAAVCPL